MLAELQVGAFFDELQEAFGFLATAQIRTTGQFDGSASSALIVHSESAFRSELDSLMTTIPN